MKNEKYFCKYCGKKMNKLEHEMYDGYCGKCREIKDWKNVLGHMKEYKK